ncbi:MAG: hypothetical protein ABMA26_15635 [Limisphaerales bacterium]
MKQLRLLLLTLGLTSLLTSTAASADSSRWWKGNLHTHSFWSDGDDFPEMIAELYKTNGYHFLAFTDHNTLHTTNKWVNTETAKSAKLAYPKYTARWPKDWIEKRAGKDGQTEVRLKFFSEYRGKFEEADKFLLIQSEEISDRWKTAPVHMNAHNLREPIKPHGGSNVVEVLQNNVNSVLEQRQRTGQPMFPHVNHPNFVSAITPEELMQVRGAKFFEVFNGHPTVYNNGNVTNRTPSMDRLWDIVLTRRLAELKLEVMYGLGTDDGHNYHTNRIGVSNPFRGWVWVRSAKLTPESLIAALEAGDFYSSSGVKLRDLRQSPKEIALEIETKPGVTYTTQFIGTRRGYDPKNEPQRNSAGEALRVAHTYSKDVGAVLAEVKGAKASYTLKGDEIYVRAKVISSKPHPNPSQRGDVETAWTQPMVPAAGR